MASPPPLSPPSPPPPPLDISKVDFLDAPLRALGFVIEVTSPQRVAGRFQVTPKCCQPFNVLHGGVSALIAEGVASIGACNASGTRSAGIQLSINHVKSAQVGDVVVAEATPVSAGKRIQVWEVQFWKTSSSNLDSKCLIASSKVTIICNIRESNRNSQKNLIHAKL